MVATGARHVFVFLEIFSLEGGIQSYVKDIFQAYHSLNTSQSYSAEVFLLRDEAGCDNPFETDTFKFHYLKSLPPWKGRLKLASSLLTCFLLRRPQHVFCGHINLATLIKTLCQPLGIPYTVLTYGKEVWESLPNSQRQALQQAKEIWTISRYSRDRLCAANKIEPNKVKILPCVVDGQVFTPGAKPPDLLKKYGLAEAKVLMTVARLWAGDIYKGVDVTIRALPQILKAFPEVKYLAIGRGDDRPPGGRSAVDAVLLRAPACGARPDPRTDLRLRQRAYHAHAHDLEPRDRVDGRPVRSTADRHRARRRRDRVRGCVGLADDRRAPGDHARGLW